MSDTDFLTLAALATVAVPDLEVESLCPPLGEDNDFRWVGVLDNHSARWSIIGAKHPDAEAALDKQQKILTMLTNYRDAHRIPFEVPRIEGRATSKDGTSIIVYRQLPGNPLEFNELAEDPDLLRALGKAVAALHEIPANLVAHVGFPTPSVDDIRAGLRKNLSRAVATGLVPPVLQARWEQALDEDAWWHFHPTFVHGSLEPQHVLVADSRILGISGFAEVSVGDPSQDLSWVASELTDEAVDLVFDAYHLGRAEGADPFLRQRTDLYIELALVNWLNWGVDQGNASIIADAQDLLNEQLERLDGDLSLTGRPLYEEQTTSASDHSVEANEIAVPASESDPEANETDVKPTAEIPSEITAEIPSESSSEVFSPSSDSA